VIAELAERVPWWGWAAGAVGGALLLSGGSAEASTGPQSTPFPSAHTDPHGHRTPPGREVAMTRAPFIANGREFVAHVIPRLEGLGLSHEQAILFAAHLARETGSGRYVWCNDWGNIKAYAAWHGDWYRLGPTGDAYEPFRAYATSENGLAAGVSFIRGSRYTEPWRLLQANDPTWYGALGRAGYYGGDPDAAQREYDSLLTTIRNWWANRSASLWSPTRGRVAR
jgi:hypothetical protein